MTLELAQVVAQLVEAVGLVGEIGVANDLPQEEFNASAVARNALLLIRRAGVGNGLMLTATGNLTRSAVAEMIDRFDWPDFDREEAFHLNKVINEPDFLPLHVVRTSRRRLLWSACKAASWW